MSTRRNILKYPKEVVATFEKAIGKTVDEPLIIPFETPTAAKSARRTFYAFREALYLNPHMYPKITLIAPCICFRLKDNILKIYTKPVTVEEDKGDGTQGTS